MPPRLDQWARSRLPGVDGPMLRRLAYLGARFGPRLWVKHSPTLFGLAFALALPQRRAVVRRNLRSALGPAHPAVELGRVLATFSSYAHCLAESFATGRADAEAASYTTLNAASLDAALAGSAGAVVVTAHVGGWEAAAHVLARTKQREVVIVMQRESNRRAQKFHDAHRARLGVRVVHVDHPLDGLELLRHLRRGGVVAIQVDRVPAGMRVITVDLFGAAFEMPEGPFMLASAAGVPLVSVFARRRGYFDYELVVGDTVTLPRKPARAELHAAACRVAGELERFLRSHPTQWFHFDVDVGPGGGRSQQG